jgi:hypothetical protein
MDAHVPVKKEAAQKPAPMQPKRSESESQLSLSAFGKTLESLKSENILIKG